MLQLKLTIYLPTRVVCTCYLTCTITLTLFTKPDKNQYYNDHSIQLILPSSIAFAYTTSKCTIPICTIWTVLYCIIFTFTPTYCVDLNLKRSKTKNSEIYTERIKRDAITINNEFNINLPSCSTRKLRTTLKESSSDVKDSCPINFKTIANTAFRSIRRDVISIVPMAILSKELTVGTLQG